MRKTKWEKQNEKNKTRKRKEENYLDWHFVKQWGDFDSTISASVINRLCGKKCDRNVWCSRKENETWGWNKNGHLDTSEITFVFNLVHG
jgi:hypothetical protein